ncbi:hypothetical protein CBR_g37112 [Chara braunii]|uniref:Uncharacterized protein n=1 Tax=Chara braunii TaxID=69332 RepID=A0A388LM53_CHABU|nr:hypothetical protein CBR_g37112 [Chara braunii]|eukprot:GBG83398.1 hypothetical protein CBR_g37112 [Chara braunii]
MTIEDGTEVMTMDAIELEIHDDIGQTKLVIRGIKIGRGIRRGVWSLSVTNAANQGTTATSAHALWVKASPDWARSGADPCHLDRLDDIWRQRAASEDPALRSQVNELASSIAMMKRIFEAEKAKKAEKAKRKQEKLELKKREKEERQAAEEARQAATRKAMKEEEKLRKDAEDRERMRKEMRMKISMHIGNLKDELHGVFERHSKESAKGKKIKKIEAGSSSEEDHESYGSDVDSLSNKIERLAITEKRKWCADKPVGDSPPMETPAKRTAKRRLQLGCRHPSMKRTSPLKTPTRRTASKKIPAAKGYIGKLKFVTENLRELGDLNVDELERICVLEDVAYEGKKMQAILAITKKHTGKEPMDLTARRSKMNTL